MRRDEGGGRVLPRHALARRPAEPLQGLLPDLLLAVERAEEGHARPCGRCKGSACRAKGLRHLRRREAPWGKSGRWCTSCWLAVVVVYIGRYRNASAKPQQQFSPMWKAMVHQEYKVSRSKTTKDGRAGSCIDCSKRKGGADKRAATEGAQPFTVRYRVSLMFRRGCRTALELPWPQSYGFDAGGPGQQYQGDTQCRGCIAAGASTRGSCCPSRGAFAAGAAHHGHAAG